MPDPLWQRLLGDPLKDITRKERRTLLGVSVLGILVAKTGLIPRKIESIGVDSPTDNAPALLLTLAAVVLYFLLAFVVYAASDFIAWMRSYHDLVEQMDFDEHKRAYEAEEAGAKNVVIGIAPVDPWWFRAWRALLRRSVLPTSVARAVVEFLIPFAVGLFALVSLLRAAHASPQGGPLTSSSLSTGSMAWPCALASLPP